MKKLFAFLFIGFIINSCSDSDPFADDVSQGAEPIDAPYVRSYTTYTSQNSVTINGFVDNINNAYSGPQTYTVGFKFRSGDEFDSSNDIVIELPGSAGYYSNQRTFSTNISSLEPNTTYYYTCYTKNGYKVEEDWESFTTSEIACTYTQNNSYNVSGTSYNANVNIDSPGCCDSGNVRFRFGTWPNIFEINFNELNNGYPNTGQYFGVDSMFDTTYIERELTKSNNQVLIGNSSTAATELFVENDGVTITIIFCDTLLSNGDVLNGKVSALIP